VAAKNRLLLRARFGDLRRTDGIDGWGYRRGTPVDRWYIERYLSGCAALVQGHCLEIQDDVYGTRLGAERMTVLDIDRGNPKADIVGDLCDPYALPRQEFDTAIVTQTLQLVADPTAAVTNLVAALRPGGTLLVTAPVVSRLAGDVDRWRWTPRGLRELLEAAAPDGTEVETTGLGNGLSGRAFLFGLAAEDLDDDVLEVAEPRYPILVGAQVRLRP
jgi:SAM-dependent methyltransferase